MGEPVEQIMLDAVDRPVLYTFRRCPYAMRARMALFLSETESEFREVVLRSKPDHMIAISPKATVPVVQLPDGSVIDESLDVMHWALGRHDPHALMSDDPALQKEMDQLIEENDLTFKTHLDRYKYPNRYEGEDALAHRAAGVTFLEKLDLRLQASGNLFGKNPKLADYAIFPFVRQFANVDRDWFDGLELPALQRWLNECLTSDVFERIMRKEAAWAPGDDTKLFPTDF